MRRNPKKSAENIDALFVPGISVCNRLVFRRGRYPCCQARVYRESCTNLKTKLNRYLAGEYQVDPNNEERLPKVAHFT